MDKFLENEETILNQKCLDCIRGLCEERVRREMTLGAMERLQTEGLTMS
jgi:hypothetical protein